MRVCIYFIRTRVYACAFSYVNTKVFDERLMTFCLVFSFFIRKFFLCPLKVFFLTTMNMSSGQSTIVTAAPIFILVRRVIIILLYTQCSRFLFFYISNILRRRFFLSLSHTCVCHRHGLKHFIFFSYSLCI